MPECYLLAISKDSSLDRDDNNFSLFRLVGHVQSSQFPTGLPLEVHVYWLFKPEEVNFPFEMRIGLSCEGKEEGFSTPVDLKSPAPIYRMRFRDAPLPIKVPGFYKLFVEWREKDSSAWNRSGVFWPLSIELQEKNNSEDSSNLINS